MYRNVCRYSELSKKCNEKKNQFTTVHVRHYCIFVDTLSMAIVHNTLAMDIVNKYIGKPCIFVQNQVINVILLFFILKSTHCNNIPQLNCIA